MKITHDRPFFKNMDFKISSSFVLLFALLWSVNSVASLTKCCPLEYELSAPGIVAQIASRSSVACVKSTDSVLAVSRPADLTIGLPDCTMLRFVDVYDKSTRVDCVDRVAQKNTIFGVRCENDLDPMPQHFTIPSIANLRKCCPPNRKYDAQKQYCWNHLAENYTDASADLLKLSMKEKMNAFVNITYGPPPCRSTEALLDRLESYQKIHITESDGVYDSSGLLLSFDEYCLDVVDDLFQTLVIRSCRDERTICGSSNTICVRKCCPIGYEVKVGGCQPSTQPFSVVVYNGSVALANVRPAILQGDKCSGGKFWVQDHVTGYRLELDGQIHKMSTNEVIGRNGFCFDSYFNKEKGTHLFLCFAEKWQHLKFKFEFRMVLNVICTSVSALFLLLTFIIYAILPSLKNAHCRLIMCYLFTSMFGYILVMVQGILPSMMEQVPPTLCKILGYSMLFTFLSSFSWLNIISFDIWSTFRAVESSFFKKSKTGKRFFLFCFYGWGFAASWTTLAVFCQSTTVEMPAILKPDIGQISCWFTNIGTSRILFFIVPVAAMITFNIILFVITVKYCAKIKSELQSHSHNSNYSIRKYTADMNEFMINIKLFILMGLNWSMELISLTVEPENRIFFLISDIVNGSGGLIIFCLFVLKRKVLRDLRITLFGEYSVPRARNRAATFTTSTSSSVVQSMINSRGT